MVRFHWHVEEGCSCMVPVNGSAVTPQGIQHTLVEMEVPGVAGAATCMLSMPAAAHRPGVTRSVGVVLAHDADASEWQSALIAGLAEALAGEGFLVMRNFCALKEARRQRMFEKALDAAATSPYARSVRSWVLAGVGNGARVAAAVGTRCRGTLAGLLLLSYPLDEPMPAVKGASGPDSLQPIVNARAPVLFVHTQSDPFCTVDALRAAAAAAPDNDCRLVVVPRVDSAFRAGGPSVPPSVVRKVCKVAVRFVTALSDGTLAECSLPRCDAERLDVSEDDGDDDEEHHAVAEQPEPGRSPEGDVRRRAVQGHTEWSSDADAERQRMHPDAEEPNSQGTLPPLPRLPGLPGQAPVA